MTIDELIAKCKGSVYLKVNDYKNSYHSVDDEFEIKNKQEDCFDWATEDEKAKIKDSGCLVELCFYPHTPIGQIKIITFSVDDALKQAEEYFNELESMVIFTKIKR